MRLNLGAGDHEIPGYISVDRKSGQEVYPLSYPDSSVEEIYASHVLEHFSHRDVASVLADWVRSLKPGGVLKVAVPNFDRIVDWYKQDREDLPLLGYLMGGQTNENDFHKAIFNEAGLRDDLEAAGLVNVRPWVSQYTDCASLEVSLNLEGTKPKGEDYGRNSSDLSNRNTRLSDYVGSAQRPREEGEDKAGESKDIGNSRKGARGSGTGRSLHGRILNWPASEAANVYSQFGEDGILKTIFDKIGTESRFCVDVGAADGLLFSNVRQFIEQGWKGLLIESNEKRFESLGRVGGQFGKGQVTCYNYKVGVQGCESLDFLLAKASAPEDFDLLSIDVDGQEYYIWNSLLKFKPRVVVIEYDPQVDPMFIPPLNGEGQAGWNALTHVAASRGYTCVGKTQTNLICVRNDVMDRLETVTEPAAAADPTVIEDKSIKIAAVASVPRLGFNVTWHCAITALNMLGIELTMVEGAFWGQCLTRGLEKVIKDGADYIVTMDYDSVFSAAQLHKMCQLIIEHPEYDAIVPVQIKREEDSPLFKANGSRDFSKPLTRVAAGHFGLSVFKASAFARLAKPWFHGQPNEQGEWNENRVDDDIWFWRQWGQAGCTLALANEVRIGHLEMMITWPGPGFVPIRQPVTKYRNDGQPVECGGGLKVKLLD